MSIKIRIHKVEYHRNGVAGQGFYTVRFRQGVALRTASMVAVVFPQRHEIAVLDTRSFVEGYTDKFDAPEYEDEIRKVILAYEESLAGCPISDEERRKTLYGKHTCHPYTREGGLIVAEEKYGTCAVCGVQVASEPSTKIMIKHLFTGASSRCDYPMDHPDEDGNATEQIAEVCGRTREEHLR